MQHITVDLGVTKISLPVAQLAKKTEKKILITGGMDGDEYTGIEAAYQLIDYYSKHPIDASVVIIPIINIPGFENYMSKNPLDNIYPKYIFPGNKNGSPTEKLMYWLYDNYIKHAHLWLDLHSGAITENLHPFISFYETSNEKLNEKVIQCIKAVDTEIITFENPTWAKKKFDLLTKNNTMYVLLESGEAGKRNKEDIQRHITWSQTLIKTFLQGTKNNSEKTVYTDMDIYYTKQNGLWHPTVQRDQLIKKGTQLGTVTNLQGKILQTLIASADGVFLWGKQALMAEKSDELIALGTKSKIL